MTDTIRPDHIDDALLEVGRSRPEEAARLAAYLDDLEHELGEIRETLYAVAGELGLAVDSPLAARVGDMRSALECIAANENHRDDCEDRSGCDSGCPVLFAKDALDPLGPKKGGVQ